MKAPETVVTQEDRDAAADAVKAYRGQKNGDWQARIRRGEADDGEMVQAFARHREQSITALQAELASARKVVEAARDYVEEAAGRPPLYSKEARATVTANANAALKRIDAWLTANGGE